MDVFFSVESRSCFGALVGRDGDAAQPAAQPAAGWLVSTVWIQARTKLARFHVSNPLIVRLVTAIKVIKK